jgi:hypothetical protein
MDKQFLTPEELQELKNLNQTRSILINQLGQLEYEMQILENQKQSLKEQLSVLFQNTDKIGAMLQEKYGDGNIDIETGEFIKQ